MSGEGATAREWFYSDAAGSAGVQKGPVPQIVLCRLLERGVGVSAQTLVWKAGMESWQPMAQVSPFKEIVSFGLLQWYFVDLEGEQKGPVFSKLLVHKMTQGEIDGLTMVYGGEAPAWKKLSEVPLLQAEMARIAEEEERQRLQRLASLGADEDQAQTQVFDADAGTDAKQPTMPLEYTSGGQKGGKGAQEKAGGGGGGGVVGQKRNIEKEEGDTGLEEGDDDDAEPAEDAAVGATAGAGAEGVVKPKRKNKKKKARKGPTPWVYVTGLPPDVTFEEIKNHFSKVGLIDLSPYDQQPRIKIYREAGAGAGGGGGGGDEACKGDCLICYNALESVQLAVDILNGGYIRPSSQVTVTRAEFTPDKAGGGAGGGGGAGEGRRGKPELSAAQVKVAKSAVRQALAWNEDDDIGVSKNSALRIVVLEGLFKPEDFDDPAFSDELETDIADECQKCGVMEKLTFFSANPRGVAIVKFGTSFAGQECVKLMNGRYFGGRKIRAYFWDGVANFSVTSQSAMMEEKEEAMEAARLDDFGDWLDRDQEELPEEFRLQVE
jgi:HIV Tat-specific factor 1